MATTECVRRTNCACLAQDPLSCTLSHPQAQGGAVSSKLLSGEKKVRPSRRPFAGPGSRVWAGSESARNGANGIADVATPR